MRNNENVEKYGSKIGMSPFKNGGFGLFRLIVFSVKNELL